MKAWKYSLVFAIALLRAFSDPAMAQNLEPAALAHPSSDSWPTYHGDYSGKRHSKLTQITPQNVGSLTLRGRFRQIRMLLSNRRRCLLTASFTSPSPITYGPLMLGRGMRSGTITSRPTKDCISAIAELRCTRGGFTTSLPTPILFR